jgi:hypothetical protein
LHEKELKENMSQRSVVTAKHHPVTGLEDRAEEKQECGM